MAPVGGLGRVPYPHLERSALVATCYFNAASLKIFKGVIDDTLKTLLHDEIMGSRSHEEHGEVREKLENFTNQNPGLFFQSEPLDVVFSKGLQGRDLSLGSVRSSVCMHSSSPLIEKHGQIGFMVFEPHASTP